MGGAGEGGDGERDCARACVCVLRARMEVCVCVRGEGLKGGETCVRAEELLCVGLPMYRAYAP